MKTINEISNQLLIARSTLLKAAQRGAFGEAAYQSGATWLVDEQSQQFNVWLERHRRRGVPPTIGIETPDPPSWVTTQAGKETWRNDLKWRVEAARATSQDWQQHLLHQAHEA